MLGQADIARSAWAVIVWDGLTPRLAEVAAPSTTVCRLGPDRIPAWRVVRDRDDGRQGMDDGAGLLGEVELVLVEAVLHAAATARHALTALDTGLAGRADATEGGA